jgi:hypothetical protein
MPREFQLSLTLDGDISFVMQSYVNFMTNGINSERLISSDNLAFVISFFVKNTEGVLSQSKEKAIFVRKMELKDETSIRIVVTLEKIKNINETIKKHKEFDALNDFAVSEWERMRQNMIRELVDLLAQSGVSLQTYVAA